jgi:parvulin-like peptidyl-prolyl isomerase
MKRSIAILTSAVLAATLLTACGKSEQTAQPAQPSQSQPAANNNQAAAPNDPLAQFPALKLPFTVDPNAAIVEYQGGKLNGKEFETFLRTISFLNPQQAGMIEAADKEALKGYAREYTATKILASRADEAVNKESKELAEKTFEKIKGQYIAILGKDASNFDKLMQNHGLTREVVMEQMVLINNSINVLKKNVNDATVKKMYDEIDKGAITVASVRHILISTEQRKPEEALKLAKDLVARLKKGEDFAKLAKEYTDDPGSKETGGLYADADVSQWVPEFKQAALTLPIGQISDPVKTDYGYHVMKVENRKQKSFDEVKDQLRQQALEKEYDKFINGELDKLITKYNVPEPKPAS